jgi:hypothetical protein
MALMGILRVGVLASYGFLSIVLWLMTEGSNYTS